MGGQAWSPDELRLVGDLLMIGLSLSAIGHQLGVSKGTVSGRVYRDAHLHGLVNHQHVAVALNCVEVVPRLAPTLPWRAEPGGVPLLDLTRGACRWPMSDGLFCGQPTGGQIYCPRHHRRAHP